MTPLSDVKRIGWSVEDCQRSVEAGRGNCFGQCPRPSPKGTLLTLQFIARLNPAPARTSLPPTSIIAHSVGHIHIARREYLPTPEWSKFSRSGKDVFPERGRQYSPSGSHTLIRLEFSVVVEIANEVEFSACKIKDKISLAKKLVEGTIF